MKILRIEILNSRVIRCFMKNLDGKNLEIAGETATGKTTGISALWDIMEKRSDPITHGKHAGQIKLKIGEGNKWLIATRSNTPKTSTITIIDSEGTSVSIAEFKKMISGLAVNPHKIMDMKPKEQVATLLKAADLGGFDLPVAESRLIELESDRLSAHRVAESLAPGPEPAKAETVSISALLEQKEKMETVNSANQKERADKTEWEDTVVSFKDEIIDLENEISDLSRQLATKENGLGVAKTELKQITDKVSKLKDQDTSPIIKQIDTAETTNARAAQYAGWKTSKIRHDKAAEAHGAIEAEIKELRTNRKSALDKAKWPIEGLTVKEGHIIYNDCLMENLGASESSLVCAALAIEDIKSHPIKVVRMDGVESMSKADYQKLKELFNGHGIQVLSTRVSRGDVDSNEITIVDGTYKEEKKGE